MIRIVYNDKVESLLEVSETAITYYGAEYFCKDIDYTGAIEDIEDNVREVVETRPQDRDKMTQFLSDMGVAFTESNTNAELTALIDSFLSESNYPPEWAEGVSLTAGDVIEFQGIWYEVLQSHTTQKFWQPDMVPALFVVTSPPDEIPEWVQPTGAHDAYLIGDQVLFNGLVYESLINGNVWSPTAYAAGWRLIS